MENLRIRSCNWKLSNTIASAKEVLRFMALHKVHKNETAHNRSLLSCLGAFAALWRICADKK